MSKVIVYTLTVNGEIPEYVIDGGYFANDSNKVFPQQLNLVGIATDEASEKAIATKAALIEYVATFSPTIYNPELRQDQPASVFVGQWWDTHVS
jgi:hypothetical protein